jgi:hypothetical protein
MKEQTMLVLLAVFGGMGSLAYGQAGAGKAYDARDPSVCKSKKDPAKGAPSPIQVRDYIRCTNEKILGQGLFLYENVQPEIGKSRPYSSGADSGAGEIDSAQPVYPVRGTYDAYLCWIPTYDGTSGKNCNVQKAAHFEGACYRTTFGDWSCRVRSTLEDLGQKTSGVPPPK